MDRREVLQSMAAAATVMLARSETMQAAEKPKEPSEKAVGIAARIWCDQDMRNIVMDGEACLRMALIIDGVLENNITNAFPQQRNLKTHSNYQIRCNNCNELILVKAEFANDAVGYSETLILPDIANNDFNHPTNLQELIQKRDKLNEKLN